MPCRQLEANAPRGEIGAIVSQTDTHGDGESGWPAREVDLGGDGSPHRATSTPSTIEPARSSTADASPAGEQTTLEQTCIP